MPTEIEEGSGNVFADIGIPDPETHELKVQLSLIIEDEMERRGLSQRAAATLMGVTQADVSHIIRGRLRGYSLERLIRCARALGVAVTLHPSVEPLVRAEARRPDARETLTPAPAV